MSKMEGLVSLINNNEQKHNGVRDGLSSEMGGDRMKTKKRLIRMTEDRMGWWSTRCSLSVSAFGRRNKLRWAQTE